MRWLLWKDYRHNRLIVFAGLVILLVPYLIGLCVGCSERWIDWGRLYRPDPWTSIFAGAAMYSLILSQLTIAIIGGNALAGERVDRSAEFLYALPVTRRRLVASKLLFGFLIAVVIWLNAPVVWYLAQSVSSQDGLRSPELPSIFETVAIAGLTFFCVAWFLSSLIASPTFAICGGLITPFLVLIGFRFVSWLVFRSESHWPFDNAGLWNRGIFLTLAPLCFAVGTWHYLRRVEP